jgi:hypothetical protein
MEETREEQVEGRRFVVKVLEAIEDSGEVEDKAEGTVSRENGDEEKEESENEMRLSKRE